MTVATLVLPWPAANLNDLIRLKGARFGGYAGYNRIKKQWASDIKLRCIEQRVPRGEFDQGAHVGIMIYERDKRRDPGNFTAGTEKLVMDGLVRCGVLQGDGWSGVLSLSYAWDVGDPCVVVTLSSEPLTVRRAG